MVTVTAASSTTNVPNCTHYEVELRVQPERFPAVYKLYGGTIAVDCTITLENSLGAIQLAAVHGYDMVELDVREARDGEPVLFHGSAGRGLWMNCGVPRFVEELVALRYRASTEHVATLAQALELCASLGLGAMLNVKAGALSDRYLGRIAELLREHDCGSSTVTIAREASKLSVEEIRKRGYE